MDLSDFSALGAKIAEISLELKSRRNERAKIQEQIQELEDTLRPLIGEHAKMIAELVGASGLQVAAPAAQAQGSPRDHVVLGVDPRVEDNKKRVLAYLQNSDGRIFAEDVAVALSLDPLIVRKIMGDYARSSR